VQNRPTDRETRFVRSLVALQLGDFATGWEDFGLRQENAQSGPATQQPSCWPSPNGDRKLLSRQNILVRSEGNLADDIMFASCLKEFARLVGRCVVQCDPELVPLMARSFPNVEIQPNTSHRQGAAPFDAEIRVGSLPRHLRNSAADFPAQRGYLSADEQRVQYWRDRLAAIGQSLKVGLAWHCPRNAGQTVEPRPPLSAWEQVLGVPGVQFVSLERRGGAAEIAQTRQRLGVELHELLPSSQCDLADVAALIGALDVVIAVPTTTAHLAGALGADVWVPLSSWPSWRWGLEGATCPWYPSMRLFRQPRRECWGEPLAQIAAHLRNAETATCRGK
jgi:hypothetical protein